MFEERIVPHLKEFPIECEQIHFWDTALSELSTQISLLFEILSTESGIADTRTTFINDLTQNYTLNCQKLSSEPSNVFYLTQLAFDMFSKSSTSSKEKLNAILKDLGTTIPEILQNIEKVRENIIMIMDKTMTELSCLVVESKDAQTKYKKIKSSLDDAQIKKKKKENSPKYTYNVSVKEQAEQKVIENVQEMEKILPKINNLKEELEMKKKKFNGIMKENLEIVLMNIFKQLANLHQCFFLLAKNKYDLNLELIQIFHESLRLFSSLSININDYTERKYAALQGIKFDSVEMLNLTDEILLTNPSQLNSVCESIKNYVVVFYQCLKNRRDILKIYLKSVEQFVSFEKEIKDLLKKNQKKYNKTISGLNLIGVGTMNAWKNLIETFHILENINKKNIVTVEIANFISESKSDMSNFLDKWSNLEQKLNDGLSNLNRVATEIAQERNAIQTNKQKFEEKAIERIKKKSNKIVNLLTQNLDQIKKKIANIRDKHIKSIMKIVELLGISAKNYEYLSQKISDKAQKDIENSTSLDIFRELKSIFAKYFKKFGIENYEPLLEKIKVKILLKIDFQYEKLGQNAYEQLNDLSMVQSLNSIILSNKPDNVFENKEENENLIVPNFESQKIYDREEEASFNENKIIKSEIIMLSKANDNVSSEYENLKAKPLSVLEKNPYETKNKENNENKKVEPNQMINEDFFLETSEEEKINFIKRESLNRILDTKNPYQNFKEPEIQKYKELLDNGKASQEKRELILENNEIIIDSFSCAYKCKILLQGKLHITNKKLVFYSLFNSSTIFGKTGTKLEIPLIDIVEITKKKNLKIFNNSIVIKTAKTEMIFTSFVSRDKCFNIIESQLSENKLKVQDDQKDETHVVVEDKNYKKFSKFKKKFLKQILQMLTEIDFFNKINQIHTIRLEQFSKQYRNEVDFLPEEAFKETFVDEILKNTPLYIIFHYIFDPSTLVDELQHKKSFFESLYIDRNDEDINITFEDGFKDIPCYFRDPDYFMSIFSGFNREELNSFLNDIHNWPEVFKYQIKFKHPIKKMAFGPDKITLDNHIAVYFVSPKCIIIQDNSYGIGFPYSDTFVSITQYRFNSDINFNQNKGKFEFNTRCTISFTVKFIKSCLFQGMVSDVGYKEAQESIPLYIYDKMKTVYEPESQMLNEMFDKITEENITRKILVKEKILQDDFQENEGESDEEEANEDDNNKVKIQSNVVTFEVSNEGETKKTKNNTNNNNNKTFDSFIKKFEGNFKAIAIIMGVMVLCLIIRVSIAKTRIYEIVKDNIDFNMLFNSIILGLVIYLFLKLKN